MMRANRHCATSISLRAGRSSVAPSNVKDGGADVSFDWRGGPLAHMARARLRAAGLTPTRQRIGLASLLFVAGGRQATVDQLYKEAKALNMPVARATVYNTLKQFVIAGLVREVAFYGSTIWYDTRTGSHCHYFDEDRQALSHAPGDLIKDITVRAPPGKKILGIDVIIRVQDDDTPRS
jgi:Fur family transcriptional regulator, iron response regulator